MAVSLSKFTENTNWASLFVPVEYTYTTHIYLSPSDFSKAYEFDITTEEGLWGDFAYASWDGGLTFNSGLRIADTEFMLYRTSPTNLHGYVMLMNWGLRELDYNLVVKVVSYKSPTAST